MTARRNLNIGRSRSHAAKPYAAKAYGEKPWAEPEDPMTAAQAAELKALAEEAGEPDAYEDAITKSEAELRINALRAKLAYDRARRFDKFRS